MSEIATPRTHAAKMNTMIPHHVSSDFARTLERETITLSTRVAALEAGLRDAVEAWQGLLRDAQNAGESGLTTSTIEAHHNAALKSTTQLLTP